MKHTPLTIIAILALALVGCGSTEADSEPAPTSESEQQAQDNVDPTTMVYEETYPVVSDHVINEYGITETAELCRDSINYDDAFDYDEFIEQIMNDAGIEVEGTTRKDPEYMGAYDATADVIYDTCEEYNSN